MSNIYRRYQIDTKEVPNIVPHPHRFRVKLKKLQLAKLLIKELIHYRGRLDLVKSRPCVYGVFSGPIGGFAPREHLCVGCLRCTVQYPEMVQISYNRDRDQLGDSYFYPNHIDTILYEAETGHIPVRGAGYRGKFGGQGWDGMWTDMSEIVRPTRDGIHGREYISTEVDIGTKPPFIEFDKEHLPIGTLPETISIPIPLIFDTFPSVNMENQTVCQILSEAARQTQTYAVLPFKSAIKFNLKDSHIIPIITDEDLDTFINDEFEPLMVEMPYWSEKAFRDIRMQFPSTFVILRTDFESDLMSYFQAGVRIFHLTADYHGKGRSGEFILDLIRKAHLTFVEAGCRDEVTLIGSGGIIAAEHMAKAIICGLDAIAIDTSALVSLQAKFGGKTESRIESNFLLPQTLTVEWGTQRLKNLAASWHSQLLEILGAMGLREVRRMRGEIGRAMLQTDLENDAFAGISGYERK